MEKQSIVMQLFKQLLLILWKLFLFILLISARVLHTTLSLIIEKTEAYLQVNLNKRKV